MQPQRACHSPIPLLLLHPATADLPFDDQICSSAVGCSLLGKATDRCKKLWETLEDKMTESPKISDDCGCEWIPSKVASAGKSWLNGWLACGRCKFLTAHLDGLLSCSHAATYQLITSYLSS